MYKNSYFLFLTVFFMSTIIVGMDTANTSMPTSTNTPNTATPTSTSDSAQPKTMGSAGTANPKMTPLQGEKAAVKKELNKNKAKLTKIREKEKLAPALAIIEERLNKIIGSSEFKAVIEKLATKEAQEITEGKSFSSIKYTHSISTDFPKITNPNKFLAWVYSIMANIEHYQLLLDKLGSAKEAQASAMSTTTGSSATAPTPTGISSETTQTTNTTSPSDTTETSKSPK
jgi:hypothetical protein